MLAQPRVSGPTRVERVLLAWTAPPSGFSHGAGWASCSALLLLICAPHACAHQAGAESQGRGWPEAGGRLSGRLSLPPGSTSHGHLMLSRATGPHGRGLPRRGQDPEGGVVGDGQRAGSGEQTIRGTRGQRGGRSAGWSLTPILHRATASRPGTAHLLARGATAFGRCPSHPRRPISPLRGDRLLGCPDGLSQASCPLAGIDRMVESSLRRASPGAIPDRAGHRQPPAAACARAYPGRTPPAPLRAAGGRARACRGSVMVLRAAREVLVTRLLGSVFLRRSRVF